MHSRKSLARAVRRPVVTACGATHEEARARGEAFARRLGLKDPEIQTFVINKETPCPTPEP